MVRILEDLKVGAGAIKEVAKIDKAVRDRMAATGETYEVAARTISDFDVERTKVVIALRMWALSYKPDVAEALEALAFRIENGDHLHLP